MLRRTTWTLGLFLGWTAACASTNSEKSTGTNWVECDADSDCAPYTGATCNADKVCVDGSGKPIEKGSSSTPDGGTGTGGASSGGSSSGSGGKDGTAGNGGTSSSGGANAGGSAPATGGTGNGSPDSGTLGTIRADCFSPGQNLSTAFESDAVGCECSPGTPVHCVDRDKAMQCTDGRWEAFASGGCYCWTPDEPEFAFSNPTAGCACSLEDGAACVHTEHDGFSAVRCDSGKWTLHPEMDACICTSDLNCGFGSRCDNGSCLPGLCEVDGVRYAAGVDGIPDPFTCNTCRCEESGSLTCTRLPCPAPPACPEGTVAATACVACGLYDGCSLTRTGCLPRCENDDDCAQSYTPHCDKERHVCSAICK